MKYCLPPKYKSFLFVFLLAISFVTERAYAQEDTTRIQAPQPVKQNAGFDVIVKMNGEIVYGLVKEVTPYYISYQRTDIPDGPVYTIPRYEVYVISYRNQVKDYINGRAAQPVPQGQIRPRLHYENEQRTGNPINLDNGKITIGLGFLRSFSKLKNKSDYSTSASFPTLTFGYEVPFNSNVQLGILLGFGTHNFSDQKFSAYDSTNNDINVKENIFGLYVYGRYYFLDPTSQIQPYILLGPGITSSNLHSQNKISFTNDNTQTILVKSGTRTTGIGIIARAGLEYYLSKEFQVYFDAGVGLSAIKVGISYAL